MEVKETTQVTAARLYAELIALYEGASELRLRGLLLGHRNVAVFKTDELGVDYSVGSVEFGDQIDRENGLAFYCQGAIGHRLFCETKPQTTETTAWLVGHGLQSIVESLNEDHEEFEFEEALFKDGRAVAALRNEVLAELKEDAAWHLECFEIAVAAWEEDQTNGMI